MEGSKILVIEDEQKVAEFLKEGFDAYKASADLAFDGAAGVEMAEKNKYDLIVLDLNLPKISGLEVCRMVRKKNEHIPIIILTALGGTDDKLTGFDYGADDYMVKPFEFKELAARVKSLLKRSKNNERSDNIIRVADLEVNTDSKIVKRGGKKIELTNKEYQLLVYLLRNKNRVVSRADIAEKIWDITFETGTNVIDVYVNFLRKKIDKDFNPKLIFTQIGMGYILKDGEQ